MRALLFIFWILCLGSGFAAADPQYVPLSVSAEEIRAKIKQLDELKSRNLSPEQRSKIDAILQKANRIEQMNDRCSEISLTEVLDASCETFYKESLPAFEREFFQVTGEIRLSAARVSNDVAAKRDAIRACYEALDMNAFHPSRYYRIDGHYELEPLKEGAELQYAFALESQKDALDDLKNFLGEWYNACQQVILRSDGSDLAPVFKDYIQEGRENASQKNGRLFLSAEYSNRKIQFEIQTLDGISGTYSINGEEIFTADFCQGKSIMTIFLTTYATSVHLEFPSKQAWNGTIYLSERDLKKGISGKFEWERGEGKSCKVRETPRASSDMSSYSSYPASSYRYQEIDESSKKEADDVAEKISDRSYFGIQALGGVNISSDPPTSEMEEQYDFEASDSDSLTIYRPYVALEAIFMPTEKWAFSIGAGFSWTRYVWEKCEDPKYSSSECEESTIHRDYGDPFIIGEISYGSLLPVGVRYTRTFASDDIVQTAGAFIEIINLVGIEIGWLGNGKLWNNVFVGFTLRLPPKLVYGASSGTESLGENSKK